MGGINNAFIDLYRLYEGESELYADYYAKICGSDMRRFMESVSRIASSAKGDPKAAMREAIGVKAP